MENTGSFSQFSFQRWPVWRIGWDDHCSFQWHAAYRAVGPKYGFMDSPRTCEQRPDHRLRRVLRGVPILYYFLFDAKPPQSTRRDHIWSRTAVLVIFPYHLKKGHLSSVQGGYCAEHRCSFPTNQCGKSSFTWHHPKSNETGFDKAL